MWQMLTEFHLELHSVRSVSSLPRRPFPAPASSASSYRSPRRSQRSRSRAWQQRGSQSGRFVPNSTHHFVHCAPRDSHRSYSRWSFVERSVHSCRPSLYARAHTECPGIHWDRRTGSYSPGSRTFRRCGRETTGTRQCPRCSLCP